MSVCILSQFTATISQSDVLFKKPRLAFFSTTFPQPAQTHLKTLYYRQWLSLLTRFSSRKVRSDSLSSSPAPYLAT